MAAHLKISFGQVAHLDFCLTESIIRIRLYSNPDGHAVDIIAAPSEPLTPYFIAYHYDGRPHHCCPHILSCPGVELSLSEDASLMPDDSIESGELDLNSKSA